ncbi:hypothetical protein BV898_16362 [Hypsibius exemplaris]|uniref:Integral membrane protein 2 n=1 Tax=Hypsibius exemplaris TaxID=2072580 RepID=A0A9X6NFT4_HYPEX|nr:hypothetical protein BV898_16362 [Hypsibius exemplaris]
MTIVTKPLTDEKKDLKPLVLDVQGTGVNGVFADGQDGVSTQSDISVYQHPYRKHRTGFLICLGLLIVLTIGCATMGGLYLYYRFSKPEGYRGTCTIRFNNNNQQQQNTAGFADPFVQPPLDGSPFQADNAPKFSNLPADPTTFLQSLKPRNHHAMRFPDTPDTGADSTDAADVLVDMQRLFNSFQQQFELDIKKQLFEILQVPKVPLLGLGRPARFIHDFSLNLTAILDMQSQDCYVMPLNRSIIKPPQDLLEFFRGLEDGTYTVDGDAVRQTYYADPLPVQDLSALGPFISRECRRSPTYMLVSRETDGDQAVERVRRDAGGSTVASERVTFGEFAGSSLHRVNIVMHKRR